MRRRRARGALAGLALALVAVASAGGSIKPSHNPANNPKLLRKPIEDFRYDYATRCHDEMPPGMKALQSWLEQNVRGESWGIYRCEKLGPHNFSLHSEDRAIDWHLDRSVPADRRAAQNLIRTSAPAAKDRNGNYAALVPADGNPGIRSSTATIRWSGSMHRGWTPLALPRRTMARRLQTSTPPRHTRTTSTRAEPARREAQDELLAKPCGPRLLVDQALNAEAPAAPRRFDLDRRADLGVAQGLTHRRLGRETALGQICLGCPHEDPFVALAAVHVHDGRGAAERERIALAASSTSTTVAPRRRSRRRLIRVSRCA